MNVQNTIAFYRRAGHRLGALLGVFLLCMSAAGALAQEDPSFSFKKLLMPGPVAAGHVEYEKQCDMCHGDDRPALCRDCHEEIDADILNEEGFHGRMAVAKELDCLACHSEHLGRDGDIVNFDPDTFNHANTDYELTGKHTEVQCSSCHKPSETYREAPSQCFDCHQKDDNHKGAFGEECSDCHVTDSWKDNRYDHSETEFALFGRHEEITCGACHPDQKYKNTPTECYACHAVNDVHAGVNGQECDKCHKVTTWDELAFDHNVDTDFKLKGGHENLNCNACHEQSGFEKQPSMRCVGCHINDDKHFGRNGRECDSCHNENSWKKQSFDHNDDTDFELHGKHVALSCESCHGTEDTDKALPSECIDCHSVDDVHNGQEGKQCDQCHNAEGWQSNVRFDHNLSSFPLMGMHAITSCESCHTSKEFRSVENTCYGCHKEDDSHKLALGTDCASCHTPNDWSLWIFDHNTQTDFKLDGAHEGQPCSACHNEPAKDGVKQSSACIACHANDDEHNKRFGRTCERCHVTESFKVIGVQAR
ncbi:MAG TPA: cytochrome c3 family protein [Marinagarivorans sp.]